MRLTRKLLLAVSGLLMLLPVTVVPVTPAQATNQNEITSCLAGANPCRGAIYGVSSSVPHFHPTLQAGGRLVQSAYIYKDDNNRIEMGWEQTRTITYLARYIFVDVVVNGTTTTLFQTSIESWTDGPVTVQIYQLAGSLGTFRFRYKPGYPASSGWAYVTNTHTPGWASGQAIMAQETLQPLDQFGLYHDYNSIENSLAGWVLATGTHAMKLRVDGAPDYYSTYYSQPSQGDLVLYTHV